MPGERFDVAVIGGGVAGLSTAARLQARGRSTVVLEQHDHVGGCAGYYETGEFTFDVGATTLVDFEPGGVGGQLFEEIGLDAAARPEIEVQDAYQVWLPDRTVTLYRDPERWAEERRSTLGDEPRHRAFYEFVDELAAAFWRITRGDAKLPVQSVGDLVRNARTVGLADLPLVRYLRWTMADALRAFDVYDDALRSLHAVLVEDTVHATLEDAPLVNAVLGVTIRRAGIGRTTGGMAGFWDAFVDRYRELGGTLETNRTVTEVTGAKGDFRVRTATDESGTAADEGPTNTAEMRIEADGTGAPSDGTGAPTSGTGARTDEYRADQVVSAVPIDLTRQIAPAVVGDALDGHVERLRGHEGGAIVVFLGVPESEVEDREWTYHQVLADYDEPLGNGNNMFVTVSGLDDDVSAPEGYRAVVLSTHCDVEPWQDLDPETYERRKDAAGHRLVSVARTVYPDLARDPAVFEVGTPVTYEAFTNRPRGAIGGYRQTMANANQRAVPQDVGIEGFYLAGDTTWPGLGTVACVKSSELAAEHVLSEESRLPSWVASRLPSWIA